MNIKLFYNVPWYMHHDRLEAKDNLKRGERRGEAGRGAECWLGEDCEELGFGVLGETKLFKNFQMFC